MVPFQQFHRMAGTDAFGAHHPLDDVATLQASALAVQDVLHGIDVETRVGLLVEVWKGQRPISSLPLRHS